MEGAAANGGRLSVHVRPPGLCCYCCPFAAMRDEKWLGWGARKRERLPPHN